MGEQGVDDRLVSACASGELDTVDRLLAEGADACVHDDAGITPLMVGLFGKYPQ